MSKKELIQSLRKENLAKEFAKVGINDEFVADFNITVSGDVGSYTGRELQAKVLGTLTRQIRKKLKEMDTFSSLKAFIDKISFGSSVIEIDTLEEMESEKRSNLIRLLSHCTKEKRGAWSLENYNDCLPIEIKSDYYDVIYHRYFTHDVKGVEYTFGNKVLSKRHDGSKLKLKGIGTEYFNLRDLANLSAKVLYVNLIEEF